MFRKLCTLLLIAAIIHNAASNVVDRAKRCFRCPDEFEATKACPGECEAAGCGGSCFFKEEIGDCKHLTCIIIK